MSVLTIISVMQLLSQGQPTDLMSAVVNGLMIVGVGTIGWAVINKAKEGDIWSAVTTGVLGALALAFVWSEDFRHTLMGTIQNLMEGTFGSTKIR